MECSLAQRHARVVLNVRALNSKVMGAYRVRPSAAAFFKPLRANTWPNSLVALFVASELVGFRSPLDTGRICGSLPSQSRSELSCSNLNNTLIACPRMENTSFDSSRTWRPGRNHNLGAILEGCGIVRLETLWYVERVPGLQAVLEGAYTTV